MRLLRTILIVAITILSANRASATHIFGMDFFYTHLGGFTYQVTLVVYGDCSSTTMSLLPVATPEVEAYNGSSLYQTIYLAAQAPVNGVEITPVCPAQLNNTFCSTPPGTIQGVKRFIYSGNITLSGPSANWLFRFTNVLAPAAPPNGQHVAGRSPNISNIANGTFTVLEATLNNSGYVNSSPTYTTIPTPFFSLNKPANYNSGAIDPNNDALVFALVPGLSTGGTVSYNPGYSAAQPLSVASGSFSFNNSTGQLGFNPNLIQSSLVVYRVSEYRNNVLVGTSMREMTFVVLNNNNNPPSGNVTMVGGAGQTGATSLAACRSAGVVSFSIFPTDTDGDDINVQWSGVPSGASFTVTGNNTPTPAISFSWNVTGVTPGTYNIFLTYTDDGCPLSSKQTLAYTIVVLPDPQISFKIDSPATCTKKAVFTLTNVALGAWTVKYYQGTTVIDSAISAIPNVIDSLSPGTYTFRITNNANCFKDTVITIINPTTTKANIFVDKPTCNKFSDGALHVTGYNSTGPYQYALDAGAYSTSGSFTNLQAGTYVVHVKDQPGCVKDTTIVLNDSLIVSGTAAASDILCHGDATGSINLSVSGGHGGYIYSINNGPLTPVNNYTGLVAGAYTLHAEDNKGCYYDTLINLLQPPVLNAGSSATNIDCAGNASGAIVMNSSGGVMPHSYSLNGAPFGPSGTFGNLVKGSYIISVKDGNGCIKKDTVVLTEPPALLFKSLGLLNPNCYGTSDGVIIIKAAGGQPPFTYAADAQPYSSNSHIIGLPQGTYVIHIKDSNNCTKDTTVQLDDPERLLAKVDMIKAKCYPIANGELTVSAGGGISPYTYALNKSGFSIRTIYLALTSGAHLVQIKDANNCILDTTVYLGDSLKVTSGVRVTDATCYGLSNGAITLEPGGGTAPYAAAVNDEIFRRVSALPNTPAGAYRVRIKDASGCMADTTVTISQPEDIVVDTFVTHSNCYGTSATGTIRLDVSGGIKPYSYLWSMDDKLNANEATDLGAGSYFIRITDSNSCRDSVVININYTDCCTPMIVNAFTPNGDGRNDVFRLLSKGEMTLKAFAVFNRFGQQVFYTDNINTGWDGSMNGKPLEVGTYFYYIKATCGNKGEHLIDLKGDVILVK